VRPGGRFVSTIVQPQQLPTEDATMIGIYTIPDPATLDRLAAYAVEGATRLTIQDTFGLDEAADAFASFTRGTLGKVVITIP
jgi:NADPH:quinone reductase-like Zn-dependent oxidoreductase